MVYRYRVCEVYRKDEHELEAALNEFASDGNRVVSLANLQTSTRGLYRYMVVLELPISSEAPGKEEE